jgi:translation initiation factor IF-2
MAGKTHRLGRVAGELNVGVSTLIDFLNSKGIKQDVNPNSKLEEGHYELLRQQFADDQTFTRQTQMLHYVVVRM